MEREYITCDRFGIVCKRLADKEQLIQANEQLIEAMRMALDGQKSYIEVLEKENRELKQRYCPAAEKTSFLHFGKRQQNSDK